MKDIEISSSRNRLSSTEVSIIERALSAGRISNYLNAFQLAELTLGNQEGLSIVATKWCPGQ